MVFGFELSSFFRSWIALSWFLRCFYKYFGLKTGWKQVFGSKEHKPWFFGHHGGWNLRKIDNALSVFFQKNRTDDMSSTQVQFVFYKKPNHAALMKWAKRAGLTYWTQLRLAFFFIILFYFNWCLFFKKNLIIFIFIFIFIQLLYFILFKEPFLNYDIFLLCI